MAEELKDQRVVTMMSPSELKAVDDWMFAHRVRSRGEAIRRLTQVGMILTRSLEEYSARPRDANYEGMQESVKELDAMIEKGLLAPAVAKVTHQTLAKAYRAEAEVMTIIANMMIEVMPLMTSLPAAQAHAMSRSFKERSDAGEEDPMQLARDFTDEVKAVLASQNGAKKP